MPVWIVELFGSTRLNNLFWLVTFSTTPFWIILIFFGNRKWAKKWIDPWVIPPVLVLIYLYCIYLLVDVTDIPNMPDATMKGVRGLWKQPFLFNALWAHRLIMDLFCGILMSRSEVCRGVWGRMILIVTWFFGPVGLLFFMIKRIVRFKRSPEESSVHAEEPKNVRKGKKSPAKRNGRFSRKWKG